MSEIKLPVRASGSHLLESGSFTSLNAGQMQTVVDRINSHPELMKALELAERVIADMKNRLSVGKIHQEACAALEAIARAKL